MKVFLTKSNKGNPKIIVRGYSYVIEKKSKSSFYWICVHRKDLFCKGRITTNFVDGRHEVVKKPTQHSHEPSAKDKELITASNHLKELAATSAMPPSQIIRENLVETQPNCRIYLPSKCAQKNKITRVRANSTKEPTSLNEMNIPNHLKYLEGELFILAESSFNDKKIIIMGTSSSLKLLSEYKCWIVDGTFKVVPTIMRQLFSIHGQIDNQIVPLVFGLMSHKSTETYSQFFYELCKVACELKIDLNPDRIISDFEQAISTAAKQYFPSAEYKACFFHFGQIIWRKVQQEHLAKKYGSSEEFNLQIRMVKSLAFVPPEEII